MKTQEPVEVIGPIGMAFYKAFSVADTFVYLPILISGLLLHLSTGDSPDNKSSLILLAAAYGITVYWPIDCLAAVIYAKGSWNLQEEAEAEYFLVLPVIALWGLVCLAILFYPELYATKEIKAAQRSDPKQQTDSFAPILLACGAISPFLYLCNDIMQSSLHPSVSVTSTSVSDLAASDMAHFLSSWLLSSSALCLLLFGIGVAKSLDGILGGLLGAVGLCNVFTATACRLASPIGDFSVHEDEDQVPTSAGNLRNLPLQSQCHIALVGVAVFLMAGVLLRDMCYTRRRTPWAGVTAIFVMLVVLGVVASSVWPAYVGLWERLSVYAILGWQFLLAVDRIRHHFMDNMSPPSKYSRVK